MSKNEKFNRKLHRYQKVEPSIKRENKIGGDICTSPERGRAGTQLGGGVVTTCTVCQWGGGGRRQAGKQRRKQDLPTPATAVPERERQTPDNHCKFEGQAGLHSRTV